MSSSIDSDVVCELDAHALDPVLVGLGVAECVAECVATGVRDRTTAAFAAVGVADALAVVAAAEGLTDGAVEATVVVVVVVVADWLRTGVLEGPPVTAADPPPHAAAKRAVAPAMAILGNRMLPPAVGSVLI